MRSASGGQLSKNAAGLRNQLCADLSGQIRQIPKLRDPVARLGCLRHSARQLWLRRGCAQHQAGGCLRFRRAVLHFLHRRLYGMPLETPLAPLRGSTTAWSRGTQRRRRRWSRPHPFGRRGSSHRRPGLPSRRAARSALRKSGYRPLHRAGSRSPSLDWACARNIGGIRGARRERDRPLNPAQSLERPRSRLQRCRTASTSPLTGNCVCQVCASTSECCGDPRAVSARLREHLVFAT